MCFLGFVGVKNDSINCAFTAEVAIDPESTPAGLHIFLLDPEPESKICEIWTRIRSHFLISE